MDMINQWMEKAGIAVTFTVLGAIIIYFIGSRLLSLIVKQAVKGKDRKQHRKDIEKRQRTLVALTLNIWRGVVIVVAGLSIFKTLFPAIDLSPVFASAGIVGIAVAFGAQTLVKDFLTGLFIVSENQYRVGDVVEINNAEGRVEQLGTRSTTLRDSNGDVHYIPNGSITHVVNKTMGYSRVKFTLSLAGDTDLDQAIGMINATGEELAEDAAWKRMIITPPTFESIETFSKSTIDVLITGKVQPSDQWRVTAEMRRRLLRTLSESDIQLS